MRAVLLAACLVLLTTPAQAAPALHVIPFPGTPDASPHSQIAFSSLAPSELRSVTVIASRSGIHTGHLNALPDGGGTAFVPNVPFAAGDHVEVTAVLRSPQAGTASGAPGATRISFSFTVQQPLDGAPPEAVLANVTHRPTDRPGRVEYRSAPKLDPPRVMMTSDRDSTSGDIFLTPHNGGPSGPMILDSDGQLVWFHPVQRGAFNLEVQHYRGSPVLTWWQGGVGHGQGHGTDVILNRSYKPVAVLHAGNGYIADLHEFQITRQGTALIDAYALVPYNLTSVGGPANGKVWDCVIQELDIKTGKVLWEWHALGHVPIDDSHATLHPGRAYDYFHLNAIEQLPDGNLLVSARNTWAVYKINRVTGQVMWELGGRHSNFHMGKGTTFEWQHDPHLTGENTLTLFDDADYPREERQSSAKKMRVNIAARTVVLEHRYTHHPPLLAGAMGSVQLLPRGNVMVGWGNASDFSEYTKSGHQIFNGTLPLGTNSYRAYRFPWTGQPDDGPALTVTPLANGDVNLYASWNGATQVASWRVLDGSSKGSLTPLMTSRRTNFETVITLASEPRYLAVQALSASGHVLGTSHPHSDPAHVATFAPDTFVRKSSGQGEVAVGCFTGHECHLSAELSDDGRMLAQSPSHAVSSGTGTLLPFHLSTRGRRELQRSSKDGLSVQITVHDSSSGKRASRNMTLLPYSISGPEPLKRTVASPTIQIAQPIGFVSSAGIGRLLAACYSAASACQASARITSAGQVIAQSKPRLLGADELGEVYFRLTPAGMAMLRRASGNQLPAQILLSNGNDVAAGSIELVRYL